VPSTFVHFIDVDQGNMVLIEATNGEVLLYDCNVTDANEARVLGYLEHVLGKRSDLGSRRIDHFVASHRDADHIRGINKIHRAIGIKTVWDNDRPYGTVDCAEYEEYMRMRLSVPHGTVLPGEYTFGLTKIRVLSSGSNHISDDGNAQSIVLKVEHRLPSYSALLTGDSDVESWQWIVRQHAHAPSLLKCEILMAGHHGSWTFFECDDPSMYYKGHVDVISPAVAVVSVGSNVYGHPDPDSLIHYAHHCRGAICGTRLRRTDLHGTMRLELADRWTWTLTSHMDVFTPRYRPSLLPPPRLRSFGERVLAIDQARVLEDLF
jgi:competence protein ComEC